QAGLSSVTRPGGGRGRPTRASVAPGLFIDRRRLSATPWRDPLAVPVFITGTGTDHLGGAVFGGRKEGCRLSSFSAPSVDVLSVPSRGMSPQPRSYVDVLPPPHRAPGPSRHLSCAGRPDIPGRRPAAAAEGHGQEARRPDREEDLRVQGGRQGDGVRPVRPLR